MDANGPTASVLALDVDGVLLDAERGGRGSWHHEVERRFGVAGDELRDGFFVPYWSQVIVGAERIEDALAVAIDDQRWPFDVETFLACWFEADFVPDDRVLAWARGWADQGVRLVLATNQEHRRAADLAQRIGRLLPLADVCYSADLGVTKRDVEFFRAAEQQIGVDSSTIVFVDDDAGNVATARRAGWEAYRCTGAEGLPSGVATGHR